MGKPIVYAVLERPATAAVITICTALHIYIQQHRLGYEDLGLVYERVVNHKEFWRLVVAQFSHIDFLHLVFNVSALWGIGVVEQYGTAAQMGTLYYLHTSALLLLLSAGGILLLYYAALTVFKQEQYLRVAAVGYSCVTFGWMTIIAVRQAGGSSSYQVLGMSIPMHLLPWGSLLLTSLIIPKASFLGHLAGIIAGYLISFGLFAWLNPWAGLVAFTLLAAGSMWNLRPAALDVSWLPAWATNRSADGDVESVPLVAGRPRIVGGVLTRT